MPHPYGQGSGKKQYDRVDHCKLARPFQRVPGTCHAAAPSVEQCFKDIEAANTGDYGFDSMRIGINVVPLIPSDHINPLFAQPATDELGGAFFQGLDAPWDSDRCLAGGALDLKGTTTHSDADWETDWKAGRQKTGNAKCGQTTFTGEPSLKAAVQRCTAKECLGVHRYQDSSGGGGDGSWLYSGCRSVVALEPGGADPSFYAKTGAFEPPAQVVY